MMGKVIKAYGFGLFLGLALGLSWSSTSSSSLLTPAFVEVVVSGLASLTGEAEFFPAFEAGMGSASGLTVDVTGSSGVAMVEVDSGDALIWLAFLCSCS